MRRAVAFDRQLDLVLRELDSINRSLFVDFRAAFGSMIQQNLIEITACDLISVISLRTESVLEVKLGSRLRARAEDFATKLFHESGARKFFVQPEAGKRFHAEWQQGFPDVKAWTFFALENDHAPSGSSE